MRGYNVLDTKDMTVRTPMKMEEFVVIVMEELKNRLGRDAEVRIKEVAKNNGVILTGISVFRQGRNIAPTVYLEKLLERYNAGDDLREIVDELVKILSEAEADHFDLSQFMEWDKARGGICFKLVNRKMNGDMLRDIPHRAFLDLEVVYYYKLEQGVGGLASILIGNRFLDQWQVTEQDLYEMAVENMARLNPFEVVSMQKMLQNMIFGELKVMEEVDDDPDWNNVEREARQMAELNSGDEMFVLTNRNRYFGASSLLCKDVLKRIAQELADDLIILPSSVHETIILRASSCENAATLKLMVEEINQSQVQREERLSDSVYRYDRINDCLSILLGDVEDELSEAM